MPTLDFCLGHRVSQVTHVLEGDLGFAGEEGRRRGHGLVPRKIADQIESKKPRGHAETRKRPLPVAAQQRVLPPRVLPAEDHLPRLKRVGLKTPEAKTRGLVSRRRPRSSGLLLAPPTPMSAAVEGEEGRFAKARRRREGEGSVVGLSRAAETPCILTTREESFNACEGGRL